MGLEATSWDWLRKGIQKELPHFSLLERVENGVGVGMADVAYSIRGRDGWIELKAVDLPARATTAVLGKKGLNKDQINWHLMRAKVLSKTWVFISAGDYRWLVPGHEAAKVNSWTKDELCAGARLWHDSKWSAEQWGRLVKILAE